MSKEAFIVAIIISVLLISLVAGLPAVEAQSFQTITIKPDGSIEPNTALLERNETTCTFKGNIFGSLVVNASNIIIDGAGYALQGRKDIFERGLHLVGSNGVHEGCIGVLVKNLKISNHCDGILVVGSANHSFIGNRFNNAGIHIMGYMNLTGDLFKHNTFVSSCIFVDYNHGGLDVITENNFFGSSILVDLAAPPVVDRNYWSTYQVKYPNAREINNTGIWDTPYVDDENSGTGVAVDYHPLVTPIDFYRIASTNPTPVPTLTPSPTPTLTPSSSPIPTQSPSNSPTQQPTFEPTLIVSPTPIAIGTHTEGYTLTIISLSLVTIAVVGGVLVYFKKRRR